jgi:hypothetical protein
MNDAQEHIIQFCTENVKWAADFFNYKLTADLTARKKSLGDCYIDMPYSCAV